MRKNASILFLLRIVKIFLGILNLSIVAKYFGVSSDRDIWLLALSTILVIDLAIWGPINETFRTKFISIKEIDGENVALYKMNSLLLFSFIASLILTGLTIYYSKFISNIIAPGYSSSDLNGLSKMIIYVSPILLFNQLTQIGTSVLNAYDVFFIPEIASFGSIIFNILFTIFFAPTCGIYSLLIAHYLGAFLLLALILYFIAKLNKDILKKLFSSKPNFSFLPFLIFALPFFFPFFFSQANSIIEKSLATNNFIGAVSILDYSRKFAEMFNVVLSSVLSTMLIPVLAKNYYKNDSENFVIEFEKIFKFGFLLIIIMVTMFTIVPNAFVKIIYPTLSNQSLTKIIELVRYFSWGSIGVFLYVISGIALMTHGKSKTYAIFGMIAQISNILINVFGYKYYGLTIFPISFFCSHFIFGAIMLFFFPIKKNNLKNIIIKLLFIFFFTFFITLIFDKINFFNNYYFKIFIYLLISTFSLLTALKFFKMEEFITIFNFIKIKSNFFYSKKFK